MTAVIVAVLVAYADYNISAVFSIGACEQLGSPKKNPGESIIIPLGVEW